MRRFFASGINPKLSSGPCSRPALAAIIAITEIIELDDPGVVLVILCGRMSAAIMGHPDQICWYLYPPLD
jgi:hypothetical protein